MIPKTIHYIWFGHNEFPDLIKECIESGKTIVSDYEFILWNEDNYDVNKTLFTRQAYEAKKYAFVSDYARIDILNKYGGIYFDTDIKVIKRFDEFLDLKGFMGFETAHGGVNPGIVIGCEKDCPILYDILKEYETPFIKENGEYDYTTIVHRTTKVLCNHGLINNGKIQNIDGIQVYDRTYFSPDLKEYKNGIVLTNTYSVHMYAASWVDSEVKDRMKKPAWKIIGKISRFLANIARKIFGEERWIKIRTKFFKGLHDKMTTS